MQPRIAGLLYPEPIRKAFPVLDQVTYLNVGTYGIMPEPAISEFVRLQSEFETCGVASQGEMHRTSEVSREMVAGLVNAGTDEIAFTRNASDGINLVLAGIDWKPGDEVITTNEEHEAMIHPLLYLQKRIGIKFHPLPVSADPSVMIERIEQVMNARTRLIAMSLVSCETGTRLPAKSISEWSKTHNILSLFDGAQASGAIPVDVSQIGCNFYSSNGHKWLSGPKGTGFFYIRKESLDSIYPAFVGAGSLQKADIATGEVELQNSARRFEYGTRSWAVTAGLKYSLDWFTQLGWENVYKHIEILVGYLKDRIKESPVLESITPEDFEASSGLTSFTIKEHQAGEVSKRIREDWKIHVRVIPHYNAIRISSAHFNTTEDIDRLIEAVETVSSD